MSNNINIKKITSSKKLDDFISRVESIEHLDFITSNLILKDLAYKQLSFMANYFLDFLKNKIEMSEYIRLYLNYCLYSKQYIKGYHFIKNLPDDYYIYKIPITYLIAEIYLSINYFDDYLQLISNWSEKISKTIPAKILYGEYLLKKGYINKSFIQFENIIENSTNKYKAIIYYIRLYGEIFNNQMSHMQSIPKRIVQYWDTTNIPSDVQASINSWKINHPDYEHIIYNKDMAYNYILKHYGRKSADIFTIARHPAQESDIFRLAYIALNGGFYVDADDLSINRIPDSYLETDHLIYLVQKNHINIISNGFFGAKPNSRIIKDAFEYCMKKLESSPNGPISLTTGPNMLSESIALSLLNARKQHSIKSFKIIERDDYFKIASKNTSLLYKQNHNLNWNNFQNK